MLKTSRRKTLLAAALLLAIASPSIVGSAHANAGASSDRQPAASVVATPGAKASHAHNEGHHGRKHHRRLNDIAEVLGMTTGQLIDELKKGKSIAQIGKSKGIGEDQLIGKLLDKERIHLKEQINKSWTSEANKKT